MAERGDDPPSNSGNDSETPSQRVRRTPAQESSRGEFRTLGMKMLNSARQHIRRYSAAANQPVAPLPSSWRVGASEPLVWSGNSNPAPQQTSTLPVESVEEYLARQAAQPAGAAPLPTATPPEVQRQAEPIPMQPPTAAPPPVATPPVVQRQAAPTKAAIAHAQRQQLLKIMEIHEGRAVREAFERGESPAAAGSLFSEEAINERMGRGKPKPTARQSIADNPESGVARTPRRRGAIIEVTPPTKQPLEDMEWENNGGGEDFAEDRAESASTSAAESPSFSSANDPSVQRQASATPSSSESEASTALLPNTLGENSSPSVDEASSVQQQASSAPSASEFETDTTSPSNTVEAGSSSVLDEATSIQRATFSDAPSVQRTADPVPSPTESESRKTPPSNTVEAGSPPSVGEVPSIQRATFSAPKPAESAVKSVFPRANESAPAPVQNVDADIRSTPSAQRQTASFAELDQAESAVDGAASFLAPLQAVDETSINEIPSGQQQVARESQAERPAPPTPMSSGILGDRPSSPVTPPSTVSRSATPTQTDPEITAASDTDVARMPDEDVNPDPFEGRAAFALESPAEPGMDSAARLISPLSTVKHSTFEPRESAPVNPDRPSPSTPEINLQREVAPNPPDKRSTPLQNTQAQDRSLGAVDAQESVVLEGQPSFSSSVEIQRQPVQDTPSVPSDPMVERTSFAPSPSSFSNEQPPSTTDHVSPVSSVVDIYQQQSQPTIHRDVSDEPVPSMTEARFETNSLQSVSDTPPAATPYTVLRADNESLSVQSHAPAIDSISPLVQRRPTPISLDAPSERSAINQVSNEDAASQPRLQRESAPQTDPLTAEMSRQFKPSVSDSIQRSELGEQPSTVEQNPPIPADRKPDGVVVGTAKPVDNHPFVPFDPQSQVQHEVAPEAVQRASDVLLPDFSLDSPAEIVPNRISPVLTKPASSSEAQVVQRVTASEPIAAASSSLVSSVAPQTMPPANDDAAAINPVVRASATPAEAQTVHRVTASEPIVAASSSPVSSVVPQTMPPANDDAAARNPVAGASATPAEAQTVQRVAASELIAAASSSLVSSVLPQTTSPANDDAAAINPVVRASATPAEAQTVQRVASEPNTDSPAPFVQPSMPDVVQVEKSFSSSQMAQINPAGPLPVLDQPPVLNNPHTIQRAVTSEAVPEDLPPNSVFAVQRTLSESGQEVNIQSSPLPVTVQSLPSVNPSNIQRMVTSETVPEATQTNPLSPVPLSPLESERDAANPLPVTAQPATSVNPPVVQRASANETVSSGSLLEQGESLQNFSASRPVSLFEETAALSAQPAIDATPIQRVVQAAIDPSEGTAPSIPQSLPPAIQRQTPTVSERPSDTVEHNQPFSQPEFSLESASSPTASTQPKATFESASLIQREADARPETTTVEPLPQQNDMNVFEALLSVGAVKPITASGNIVRRQSDINRVSEPANMPQNTSIGSGGDFEQTVYTADSPEADLLRLLDLSPDTPVVRRKQNAVPPSDIFTLMNTPEAVEADSDNFRDQAQPSINTMLNLQRSTNRGPQSSTSEQVSTSESSRPRPQSLIQREMEQMSNPVTSSIQQPVADELEIGKGEGINLEALSRQVYHMLQHRLRVERERRGRL